MYEMYNKDGSFRCYRIQRTVKDPNNNKKKIYAYSKTSLKDCKIKMNKMLASHKFKLEEEQKKLESKYNFDQYTLNYYELYIKNANFSKGYKTAWKSIISSQLIRFLRQSNEMATDFISFIIIFPRFLRLEHFDYHNHQDYLNLVHGNPVQYILQD